MYLVIRDGVLRITSHNERRYIWFHPWIMLLGLISPQLLLGWIKINWEMRSVFLCINRTYFPDACCLFTMRINIMWCAEDWTLSFGQWPTPVLLKICPIFYRNAIQITFINTFIFPSSTRGECGHVTTWSPGYPRRDESSVIRRRHSELRLGPWFYASSHRRKRGTGYRSQTWSAQYYQHCQTTAMG
jgi:hypothetical protein